VALVSSIITDALTEIGVISQGEAPTAAETTIALLRLQNQIDAWAADRLTLAVQSRTSITWPASTSTQTIGPSGANITAQRPVWINTLNYVIPGSSPEVEVVIGPMDEDSYAAQSIKALSSQLPLNYFYQTSLSTILGTLFLWPQPDQELTLYLYAPQAVTVPAAITDVLLGPPGYQEAFMYQLALRLCQPFGAPMPQMLPQMAAESFARMKRPNTTPGLLGVDTALIPTTGGGYNILTDVASTGGNR